MLDIDILQRLFDRPDLPQLAETLMEKLTAEGMVRERFHHELTPSVKAEFIAGEIVMHSPAKAKHLRAVGRLSTLLCAYVNRYRLGQVFSEKALVALTRNDYEPDIVFYSCEKSDRFTEDQLQFPAPDFIVEVLSESTERRDRGVKFDDYAAHSVREYWIIDCDEQSVEQYVLRSGESCYYLSQKLNSGELAAVVIDRFRIPVAAIFDDAQNMTTLLAICSGG